MRILPSEHWKSARHAWRLADEMGFDHAWTYDHVAWRERMGSTWYAAMPTLAAAAGITERIQLGTLVSSPNFRHPVPFAKEVVTLDDLSDGRFILGLGAGSGGADAQVMGNDPWSATERSARFQEFVELTDKLLRTETTDHAGRYYGAMEACIDPDGRTRARVPIAVAATGPRGMRTAARHADIWVTNGHSPKPGVIAPRASPDLVREQISRLSRICADENRDPCTLRKLVHLGQERSILESAAEFVKVATRYRDAGVTDLVVPFPDETSGDHRYLKVLEQIANRGASIADPSGSNARDCGVR
ncbi:LLM class flavin-dependent oxidoreductase [Streptomyces sp. GXMU-J15]|uniref:LLM class flavin-dependent oxidoreductase n=1 Tax=Streptomyces fuscus TaxID=3048495 RepID=A0ABT7JAW8_9ACTN|nr:LLM class flavin-dependent oxidoreductase [Streptomyces fuscus]MDL2082021.1 LLM class flavin-dependent oxidoreductase [Streptomyces fuscus]